MRTTLTIDPVVLSAARAKARAEGITLGRAVSELALEGIRGQSATITKTGFPVLEGDPRHVVTDELVRQYRDDEEHDAS